MKKTYITSLLLTGLLSACASHPPKIDTMNLSSLQNAYTVDPSPGEQGSPTGPETSNHLRFRAIEEAALSLGAQSGLAATYQQINVRLEQDKRRLENTFNFNGMMLSHGVLPPVLEEGDNTLNQDDPDTIRVADKNYKIILQARFATTPPNWREYLKQSYEKPEEPNKLLLPKTKEERALWSRSIKSGWDKGVEQAYNIFQQSMARLKRDYQGMILYRKLLQQHMISAPYISKTELGITGNGDDMRVNDQVLRITVHPQLQTDSAGWRPVVVKQDE